MSWRPSWGGKGQDDLVFTSPQGEVLRNTNFRPRIFDPGARRSGLDGLTPHDLRHTAASLAVAAGANVKAVQQMLGHASAAMTLDVYAGYSRMTWTPLRTSWIAPFLGVNADSVLTDPTRAGMRRRAEKLQSWV